MADETIWTLGIDAEGAFAALDELEARVAAFADSLSAIGDSASALTPIDDVLAAIAEQTDVTAAGFDTLDASLSSLTDLVDIATTALQSIDANLAEMAAAADTAAAGADAAGSSFSLMGAMADAASGAMDALQAAMGPLMMIVGAAALVGQQFLQMGEDGQKGEALLRGMAGASQSDINALEADAQKLGVTMQEAAAGFYEVESAGYQSKDAITVFDAAERLALGGQAQAKDVMSGLTAIMHDYGATAQQATQYTDDMAEAQFLGKQSMQDLATSIGPLAAAGAQAGYSFKQVAAAEATMTQINPSVMRDSQQLRALFQSLDPALGKLEAAVKKTGVSFDMAHYKSLDLQGQLQYLAQIAGGTNTAAFHTLTGGVQGSTAAVDLMIGKGATFKQYLQDMQHDTGQAGVAFKSWEDTIPAALDHVGASLSIFATKLMDAIGPKIAPIIDKLATAIGQMADFVSTHMNQLMPIFAGLAAILGGAVIGAIAGLIASLGWILPILLGIGAVVAGIVAIFQHWGQIMGAVNHVLQLPALHPLVAALQAVGGYIAASFVPVWQQLVQTWQSQLLPAFTQLWTALQPVMPTLKQLAEVVGGVVVVALVLLISAVVGVVHAFASALPGVIQAFGGIVQFISGAVQVILGIITLFSDLFAGKWDKLGSDLGTIWQGIVSMAEGAMNALVGVFSAAVGLVIGFISGFASTALSLFAGLWSSLTGQTSAGINNIVNWFNQLPSMAIGAIQALPGMLGGFFSGLASSALSWGASIVNGIANGIRGAIGNVTSAISSIAGAIGQFMPHSPAEQGELQHLNEYGPKLVQGIADGMTQQQNKIRAAAASIAQSISGQITPTLQLGGTINAQSTFGGGSTQHTMLLQQMVSLLMQIQASLRGGPSQTSTVNMNNTIQAGGIQNAQQLYNLLLSLGGYSYQDLTRGAGLGIG